MRVKDAFDALCESGKLTVVERVDVPARLERVAATPSAFNKGALRDWLTAKHGQADTVWNHQAVALQHIANVWRGDLDEKFPSIRMRTDRRGFQVVPALIDAGKRYSQV